MTAFGKYLDRGVRSLAEEAVTGALADAGAGIADVGMVFFGNAASGLVTRQECVRGQVALRDAQMAFQQYKEKERDVIWHLEQPYYEF